MRTQFFLFFIIICRQSAALQYFAFDGNSTLWNLIFPTAHLIVYVGVVRAAIIIIIIE